MINEPLSQVPVGQTLITTLSVQLIKGLHSSCLCWLSTDMWLLPLCDPIIPLKSGSPVPIQPLLLLSPAYEGQPLERLVFSLPVHI